MTALTVRLADEKYERLKQLARERGTSVKRLVDEMATLMIAEHAAETRFRARASRGSGREREGIARLDKALKPDARTDDERP